MNAWWVGTVSTLAGTVVGALLQAWRERLTYRRQMSTRWDEYFLKALSDYLASADNTVRSLWRAWEARANRDVDLPDRIASAEHEYEAMHEKTQMVTLLTGGRDNPLRRAAREMREPLFYVRNDIVHVTSQLSKEQVQSLLSQHRTVREQFISMAQSELGVLPHD
jgi:hypothetical protein